MVSLFSVWIQISVLEQETPVPREVAPPPSPSPAPPAGRRKPRDHELPPPLQMDDETAAELHMYRDTVKKQESELCELRRQVSELQKLVGDLCKQKSDLSSLVAVPPPPARSGSTETAESNSP